MFKEGAEQTKEWGSKGGKARVKKQEDLWKFIASGGAAQYHALLDRQLAGEEINKEQKEGMDRVEKLFPFVKAKLSSVDMKHEVGDNLKSVLDAIEGRQ